MRYLTIAILLTACVLLYTENQLDIIWQAQSEQANDNFGYYVESLDFNGDGIDDLAVNARRYYNDSNHVLHRGKLYIYFGSDTGLAEAPDISISVPADTAFHYIVAFENICNLGDMNNDGCDDIGYNYVEVTYDSLYHSHHLMRILLGNTVNDTIPDYEYEVSDSYAEIHPLGDINGDGYDDAGITDIENMLTYSIVYGGSFEKVTFVENLYTRSTRGFWGLGDVNGDGYSDFIYHFEEPLANGTRIFHNCFFFGGTEQDTLPDYDFVFDAPVNTHYILVPAGDWNGDGYSDFAFTGYDPGVGCRLWRGGETIDWDSYGHIYFLGQFYPSYGDLNGDGKGDLVCTYIYGIGGYLYMYIGDQNGTYDYNGYTYEDGFGPRYGHAIGDFDNDGYDDIAVGAYGDSGTSWDNWGYVFVYGGHEDLEEINTDTAEEETMPPADITFNAYPNPFNPEISFEIKMNHELHDVKIEIYNIRGQRLVTIPVSNTRDTITWDAENYASGVYFCKLNAGNKILQTRKVTLMK